MKAVLLAGGRGTRLRPLTNDCPKPMLSVCNVPLVDYTVAQLYYYGIKDIFFTLGFMSEKIIEWAIGYTGIDVNFSVENTPLGTLGSVKALNLSDDVFIVMSGDGLSNINLNALLNRHLSTKAEVTIAVKKVDEPSLYGVAKLNNNGFVDGFIEKPHSITQPSYINLGVYAVNLSALSFLNKNSLSLNDSLKNNDISLKNNDDSLNNNSAINKGNLDGSNVGIACDFATDLFPILANKKKLAYYEHKGYWRDIGDFKSYYAANFDLKDGAFFPPVANIYSQKYSSKLIGNAAPSLVSFGAELSGVAKNSIVGSGCVIEPSAVIEDCIILDNTIVSGPHKGSIILGGEEIF